MWVSSAREHPEKTTWGNTDPKGSRFSSVEELPVDNTLALRDCQSRYSLSSPAWPNRSRRPLHPAPHTIPLSLQVVLAAAARCGSKGRIVAE